MSKRARRKFTDEFKTQAVELVRSSGKSIRQLAKDLDLTETALREWVKKASEESRPDGPLSEDERTNLRRLEEENRVLRMERDFLKKRRPSSRRRRRKFGLIDAEKAHFPVGVSTKAGQPHSPGTPSRAR